MRSVCVCERLAGRHWGAASAKTPASSRGASGGAKYYRRQSSGGKLWPISRWEVFRLRTGAFQGEGRLLLLMLWSYGAGETPRWSRVRRGRKLVPGRRGSVLGQRQGGGRGARPSGVRAESEKEKEDEDQKFGQRENEIEVENKDENKNENEYE